MLRIGTSGFSFEDWKGVVYPAGLPSSRMFDYYQRELGLDACELNFTFYRQPSAAGMGSLVRRALPGFLFTVKCHRTMTHELWDEEGRLRSRREPFDEFRRGVAPLARSGMLGCILAQYPMRFRPSEEALEHIRLTKEWLGGLPLAVEFRHVDWCREEALDFLRSLGVGYCAVDEPRLPGLMPFVPAATSDVGYVRLHGRNRNWFRASREERYDYKYSDPELGELVPGIRAVEASTRVTFVFFNNCHAGSAALNALRLKELLGLPRWSADGQLGLL